MFFIEHTPKKILKWNSLLLHFEWKLLQNVSWLHDCILVLNIAKVFSIDVLNYISNSPLLTLKTFFPYIIFKKDSWFLKFFKLSNIRIEEEFEFQFLLWKEKKNPQFSKLKEEKLSNQISPTSPKEERTKDFYDSLEEESFEGYSSRGENETFSDALASDSPSSYQEEYLEPTNIIDISRGNFLLFF